MGDQLRSDQDIDRIFTEYINRHPVNNKDHSLPATGKKKKRSNQVNQVDLHGDTLQVAIHKVQAKIRELNTSNSISTVKIITGKGKHSQVFHPVLKTGIGDFLSEHSSRLNIEYREWEGGFDIWKKNF